ncbi:MAG: Tic20 family protein [Coleofasciculaceae cyanobacterium]
MTWRGATDFKDRIFACLPYLIPLFEVVRQFGMPLLQQFPALQIILIPLIPVQFIYRALPFGLAGIIIFFMLFLLVVRNERIPHFIRFNTMQAILLDIALFLIGLILGVLSPALGNNLLTETLVNVVFLATLAACGYSVVQSLMGRYAEIPTISEAVYAQVR